MEFYFADIEEEPDPTKNSDLYDADDMAGEWSILNNSKL